MGHIALTQFVFTTGLKGMYLHELFCNKIFKRFQKGPRRDSKLL